jgi:hypothetical protein
LPSLLAVKKKKLRLLPMLVLLHQLPACLQIQQRNSQQPLLLTQLKVQLMQQPQRQPLLVTRPKSNNSFSVVENPIFIGRLPRNQNFRWARFF